MKRQLKPKCPETQSLDFHSKTTIVCKKKFRGKKGGNGSERLGQREKSESMRKEGRGARREATRRGKIVLL